VTRSESLVATCSLDPDIAGLRGDINPLHFDTIRIIADPTLTGEINISKASGLSVGFNDKIPEFQPSTGTVGNI
jgi:hypothetical protein